VILLNSPYAGSATGQSTTSLTDTISISASAGLTYYSDSTTSASNQVSASNGQAEGLFQLATWTLYSTKLTTWSGPNQPCTSGYIAQVTNWQPNGYVQLKTWNITAVGTKSDSGEPTSFSYGGYSSITFQNGYTNNNIQFNTCSSGQDTYSVSQTTVTTIGATVTVSGDSASGTATISTTTSGATSFTYTFPANTGIWDSSYLSSNGNGLAFSYAAC
jgi:hypothetical protein